MPKQALPGGGDCEMIKRIIVITLFFLISNMGVCGSKWNCIYENMLNHPAGSCWNRNGGPIYDSVKDEIVLCSRIRWNKMA